VSSTWIRELLAAGAIEEAAALLGRPPAVRGVVVHGAHRGRRLGYPTANLAQESDGMIPADGVYAGRLIDHGRGRAEYPAAISVGSNPTFAGARRTVEAYLLDFDGDLYGEHVGVEFVERLRPMLAFSGVPDLLVAMAEDVARTRAVLGLPEGPA
jgi:riboflavin kinase/FMN adenylyltransferase